MAEEKLERIYTVPLGKAYEYKRTNRVPRAVKLLRQFVSRHMKTELENVLVSVSVNNLLWTRSIQKPPRRVKVRVIRQAGITNIYLPDEMTAEEKTLASAKKAEAARIAAEGSNSEAKKEEKSKKEAEEKAKKDAEKAKAPAKPAANMPAAASSPAPVAKPAAPPAAKTQDTKPAGERPAEQKK